MKSILLLLAATVFTSGAVSELPLGATMPMADVKMKDISGKEVSLNDAKKKNGLLVMFSCNTCPWVVKNEGRTRDIAAYALQKNVGVILINSNEGQRSDDDSFEAMQAYAKKNGYRWFYTVDKSSAVADAFGASRTPENYLFNADGKLVYHGAIDDNPGDAAGVKRAHLKEAIDEMLGGKDVSVKTTRSIGCSIKRVK